MLVLDGFEATWSKPDVESLTQLFRLFIGKVVLDKLGKFTISFLQLVNPISKIKEFGQAYIQCFSDRVSSVESQILLTAL